MLQAVKQDKQLIMGGEPNIKFKLVNYRARRFINMFLGRYSKMLFKYFILKQPKKGCSQRSYRNAIYLIAEIKVIMSVCITLHCTRFGTENRLCRVYQIWITLNLQPSIWSLEQLSGMQATILHVKMHNFESLLNTTHIFFELERLPKS